MKRAGLGEGAALVLLIVVLAIVAGRTASVRPAIPAERLPHHTITSAARTGWKAFSQILAGRGYIVRGARVAPRDWPDAAAVMVTGPAFASLEHSTQWDERQASAALAWVARGGRLVVFAAEESALTRALDLEIGAVGAAQGDAALCQPIPALLPVERVRLDEAGRWIAWPPLALPLVRSERSEVVVALRHGKGLVIAVSAPGVADNAGIGSADNARLVAGLVDLAAGTRKGPVLFDEYHQGFADTATFWRLIGPPGQLAFWQLALVAALAAWAAGRRFGRPIPALPISRTSDDYVRSVADLYRAARAADAIREALRERFRRELAAAAGVATDAPNGELAQRACRARGAGRACGRIESLLARMDAPLPDRGRREPALQELAREIEAVRKELGFRE